MRHQECHFLHSPSTLIVQLGTWSMHSSQPARTAPSHPRPPAYTSSSHIPTTQGHPSLCLLQPQSSWGGLGAEHPGTHSSCACSSSSHPTRVALEHKAAGPPGTHLLQLKLSHWVGSVAACPGTPLTHTCSSPSWPAKAFWHMQTTHGMFLL